MATLTFTKKTLSTGDVWEAEITGQTGTIAIDLERKAVGGVTVWGKVTGASNYKYMGTAERARYDANLLFNINCGDGTLSLKIVSGTEVTSGNYA